MSPMKIKFLCTNCNNELPQDGNQLICNNCKTSGMPKAVPTIALGNFPIDSNLKLIIFGARPAYSIFSLVSSFVGLKIVVGIVSGLFGSKPSCVTY